MSDSEETPKAAAPARRAARAAEPRVPDVLPVLPSGPNIMYPQQLMPVLATEERDIRAIDEAASSPAKMLAVFSQEPAEDGNYEGGFRQIGTAATIVRMAKAPDGSVHAILQGAARVRLTALEEEEPVPRARVEVLREQPERDLQMEALTREVVESFVRVIRLSDTLPAELETAVANIEDPAAL